MSLCIDCKTLAAPQKKGLFHSKKRGFLMVKRGFFPISPPVLRWWDKEFQLSPAFIRWFPMPSFEDNTSAFFWGSVSFSCNSSLPDDAGCKSAFFMESASSPGRAACRNSISYSFRFCFLFQERGKAAAKALFRITETACSFALSNVNDMATRSPSPVKI